MTDCAAEVLYNHDRTERVRVVPDYDDDGPRGWDGVGYAFMRDRWETVVLNSEDLGVPMPRNMLAAISRALDGEWDNGDRNGPVADLDRWLRIFHGGAATVRSTAQGEVLVVATRELLDAVGYDADPKKWVEGNIGCWAQWLDGDVYTLIHERRDEWVNTRTGESMTTWEDIDAMGSVYGLGEAVEEARSWLRGEAA